MDLERKKINNKIFIIGVDGMDPRATEHYLAQGKMPNTKKLLEQGAANEHLEMIGGHPTGTPPMWTTLATGCYANVHGITCFHNPSDKGPEYVSYALDSRKCLAEPLWNVFVENEMKTLVWHWPGSAWPPTSDSPFLHVVDGTQPAAVNLGTGVVTREFFAVASKDIESLQYKPKGATEGIEPCAIDDLASEGKKETSVKGRVGLNKPDSKTILLNNDEGTDGFIKHAKFDKSMSPIKEAKGWTECPEDALEFTLLMSGGFIRRPALIVKNEQGIYDTVKIYEKKSQVEPIAVLTTKEMVHDILDFDFRGNDKVETVKSMRLLSLEEDGSALEIFISADLDIHEKQLFSPQNLYDKVVENVGYPVPALNLAAKNEDELTKVMLPLWDKYCKWQSDAIQYLIEAENYDVIFSHCHNVDAQMHSVGRHMKHRDFSKYSEEAARDYMEKIYIQTDNYIGSFLHYLDEGWTLFLVSDHALVCPEYEKPEFGDVSGINVGLMRDLGFTVMKKDEDGNETHEVDWSKTKAVASRANNIYINLKGRYDHGIVEPEDKYQVEEEIMTALYGVRHPESGQRIIACALRNKDAIIFGYGGDRCGDIVAWTAEGYNDDHFDAMTTTFGLNYTSLLPIFIAAGKGIKKGELTKRVIRQADVTPTVAVIGGVRMPEQCEGAPIYQILEEAY